MKFDLWILDYPGTKDDNLIDLININISTYQR